MKKLYFFLALAAMIVVGATTASAEKRYTPVGGFGGNEYVTAGYITPGTQYVLHFGSSATADYLKGTGKSSNLTDDNLYEFVEAGVTDNGDAVYQLKQVSTGQYLLNNGVGSQVDYTTSATRAWKFTAKDAMCFDAASISYEGQDWSTATTCDAIGGVVLADADYEYGAERSTISYFSGNSSGKVSTFSQDSTANVWVIYEVEPLTGVSYLMECLQELFGDGGADLYNVGDQPGQVSQEVYDELINSYNDAVALMNEADPSQEACEAAIERCAAALENAKNTAVKVAAGYYFFGGWRTALDANGYPTNATYEEGNMLRWTYALSNSVNDGAQHDGYWEYPEGDIDPSYAKYIWILKENPDAPGSYFIQNYSTKRYVGRSTSYNDKVHSTEKAEESYLIYPVDKQYFAMECYSCIEDPVPAWPADGGLATPCRWLHQASDHDGVMMWTESVGASHWTFFSITEDEIANLEKKMDQYLLNEAGREVLDAAKSAYEAGFTYAYYTQEASQYWTNAQESTEGPIENICDGKGNTFFHTDWHGTYSDVYHYIAVDLGEAVDEVLLTLDARGSGGQGAKDCPSVWQVYGSNTDPRLGEGEFDESVWEEIEGTTADTLTFAAYTDDAGVAHTAAYGRAQHVYQLGKAYQYLKFEPRYIGRGVEGEACIGAYWNCGEFMLSSDGLVEKAELKAVPEDVRQALVDAMAEMEMYLEDEAVTQEMIDKLQAALDEFQNNYPDPQRATDAIEAAREQLEAAEEGTEIGYFQTGAKAALEAALTAQEANIKEVMTAAEVNAVVDAVAAALAEFNSKLILPEDGYYYLQSESEGTPGGGYVYANRNFSGLGWSQPDAEVQNRLNYIWKLTNQADGTIKLQNVGLGQYLWTGYTGNQTTWLEWEADSCVISMQSAKVPGLFNFIVGKTSAGADVYLNAQPNGENTYGATVTWTSASGRDNSAFSFKPYDESSYEDYYAYGYSAGNGFLTMPFNYTITGREDAEIYGCLGRIGNKVQLQKLDGAVEAGTPVYVKPESEEGIIYFEMDENPFTDGLVFSQEPKEVNGLVGVYRYTTLAKGLGFLYNGTVVLAEGKSEGVSANTAYFTDIPETTTEGDLEIEIEALPDAIENVLAAANGEVRSAYTISGVRLQSVKNLPAGLYIINGKKVLVK